MREKTDMPIVLMGYYNPIYSYGVLNFIKHAKAAGIDGVIIPDLIPEEANEFIFIARQYDLNTIFLATPTSSGNRFRLIARKTRGFLYYVCLAGVTGARQVLPAHISQHIKQIKKISKIPVCIGFGVSTPRQVRALSSYCDGIIVGSAIIDRIEMNLPDKQKSVKKATSFVKGMMKGLR
ncbi:MAG: tryptophan synthase subunit alpha [Dehalococcoidia bacterium]|nr:MAG: tryptophan synthase subunit alpha [Dehalococcoidia bacterium]